MKTAGDDKSIKNSYQKYVTFYSAKRNDNCSTSVSYNLCIQVNNFHFPFYQSSAQKMRRCTVCEPATNLQTCISKHPVCLVTQKLFFCGAPAQLGAKPPYCWGFKITHNYTHTHTHTHPVRLLRTSDQHLAQTSTWQHTTITEDEHPRTQRDSNLQS